jgi:hypothetical protein
MDQRTSPYLAIGSVMNSASRLFHKPLQLECLQGHRSDRYELPSNARLAGARPRVYWTKVSIHTKMTVGYCCRRGASSYPRRLPFDRQTRHERPHIMGWFGLTFGRLRSHSRQEALYVPILRRFLPYDAFSLAKLEPRRSLRYRLPSQRSRHGASAKRDLIQDFGLIRPVVLSSHNGVFQAWVRVGESLQVPMKR